MRIYMYLARRDKKGIKVLTVFEGKQITASRVSSIKNLGIPDDLLNSIEDIIFNNRMYWETWIECAENYQELRTNLKLRGYTNIPINNSPAVTDIAYHNLPNIETSSFKLKKTMIKKAT